MSGISRINDDRLLCVGQDGCPRSCSFEEAAARALLAGTDMDMVSCDFLNTLEESIAEGKVAEEQINAVCRRVLETKY